MKYLTNEQATAVMIELDHAMISVNAELAITKGDSYRAILAVRHKSIRVAIGIMKAAKFVATPGISGDYLPDPIAMHAPAGIDGDKFPVWHRGQVLDAICAAVLAERESCKLSAALAADVSNAALELPELESLADIPYAKNTPDEWDEDYRSIWQQLQVAKRNLTKWAMFVKRYRALSAPVVPVAAQPAFQPQRSDLEAIDKAMQHMGDQLNTMDIVDKEDEEICSPGFDAIARLLSAAPQPATSVTDVAKDAARYRWLRDCDWFSSELCVLRNPKKVLTTGSGLGADCPSRFRLDEAIDAAIAAQQGEKK